ncbi:MAG: nickel pincer cofactor biosynthesis protein LarC [Bacteroidota bacterium]|nr:nickel pincer cofactor biosynthesis protein LarC [Bacteroidota bacterium]
MKQNKPVIYYDCFSGISGDMNLAAMIDLGVPENYLVGELKKLDLQGYEVKISRKAQSGIFGTRVDVFTKNTQHEHRSLKDIHEIIDKSRLDEDVKKTSKKIFAKLGIAEAKVHEIPLEKVHFHEVGAVDSIIDIVGAAICFHYLDPVRVFAGTIETGSGSVNSEHGILPVPAPATVELLKGIPIHIGGQNFECTTPTGAAIIATFVNEFTNDLSMNIQETGYGIGHKKASKPNFLRVYLAEASTTQDKGILREDAWLIESNIDDMNPEWYEVIIEKLLNKGAHDVFLTNILMKKSRPAIKLSVLCGKTQIEDMKEILLTETTSLGLRVNQVEKTFLARESFLLETRFGEVRIKSSFYNGKLIHQKPEYDDCKKISLEKGMAMEKIFREIDTLLKKRQEDN